MNEQRRQILEMLAEGKITADEAERLIAALERARPEAPAAESRPKSRPRYLRVVMSWTDDPGGEPGRINLRVPLQLLRAGVRLASLVPPQALDRANAELDRAGVPIDLAELRPQHLEALIDELGDVLVDLDDPGTKIKVFCE